MFKGIFKLNKFSFLFFLSLLPGFIFAQTPYHHKNLTHSSDKSETENKLYNRIGVSFAGAPWSLGGLIDYDRIHIFSYPNWSLGLEIGLYGLEFTIMPRALRWENKNMSGFYAGPKLYFSNGQYKHDEYRTFFGIGAEGGWVYRFPEQFDVGAGIDLALTSDGPWGSVKITAGYLF